MICRDYNPDRDRPAIQRIWREVGWLEAGKEEALDWFTQFGHALVADVDGEPECLVCASAGDIRYLDADLPFGCINAVTTSPVGRQGGRAGRTTAAAVARCVADGAAVCGLGMFDQGYYNRLGFGTGSHDHWVGFDPATLKVDTKARSPKRLGIDDWEAIHASRMSRPRRHGNCRLFSPLTTRAGMRESDSYGLGYYDEPGELSHHLCGHCKNPEGQPLELTWLVYHNREQFIELMSLLKGLSDQVKLVRLTEPSGIQMQDLIDRPFRNYNVREKGKLAAGSEAVAWWQMRICDLAACLAQTHLPGETVRFNLELTDPIERYLPKDAPWRGVSGEYVMALGPESGAARGSNASLPTLRATINAFTRMWLGVQPARGLALTDDLEGPVELLEALEKTLRLPQPKPEWGF